MQDEENECPSPDELMARAILHPEEFSDGEPEDGQDPDPGTLADGTTQRQESGEVLKFRRGEVL